VNREKTEDPGKSPPANSVFRKMVAKSKAKPVNVNRFGRTGGKKKVGSDNDKAKEALLL